MGTRGPAPKRRKLGHTAKAAKAAEATKVAVGASTRPMRSNPKWHPVARRWFDSLGQSAQSQFYVASDWATAYAVAESMSREFKPQPVQIEGKTVLMELPPKAAALAAWLKGATALLATEGDRRRAALELQLPPPKAGDVDVAWFDDARRRLRGSG